MSTFICQTIYYLFAHQCELDANGNITPKYGYEFQELFSREKIEFTELPQIEKGNTIYEQSITVINSIADISLLNDLNNSHIIIKIDKLNSDQFTWGSLKPYNPVQVTIKSKNRIVDLIFKRTATIPEYF